MGNIIRLAISKGLKRHNDDRPPKSKSEVAAQTCSPNGNIPQRRNKHNTGAVYIALHNYKSRTDKDLSIQRGERLVIISKDDRDWWMARSLESCKEGYVPSNFLTKEKTYEAEEWFDGKINRIDAEKRLMQPGLLPGTFIIRKGETRPDTFALSIRDGECVRHYRIRKLPAGLYCISYERQFRSMAELVQFYQSTSGGLCCRLEKPCPPDHLVPASLCKDAWEIPRSTLKLIKLLGGGQFGDVHVGIWNGSVKVAVKTLRPGSMSVTEFLSEANIMKELKHANLVQLYAVCTDSEPILIVTELMENGNLLDFVQKTENRLILSSAALFLISAQVAAGMEFLESRSFIHRDLAARNVLVGDKLVCKVADFGLARICNFENEYLAREGSRFPVKWTAPEAIFNNKFSTKSDVWSYGILLWEIFTFGDLPYPGMTNSEAMTAVRDGYRMPRPKDCPEQVYEIMCNCWQAESVKRPTFECLRASFEDFNTIAEGNYNEV